MRTFVKPFPVRSNIEEDPEPLCDVILRITLDFRLYLFFLLSVALITQGVVAVCDSQNEVIAHKKPI
jgi:hypothetical protein